MRRGRDFFRAWSRHRHVARRTFLEQEFGGPDHRLGVETVPHHPIVQDIRDRDQRHALMMRHIGPHDGDVFSFGHPCAGVIQRLIKPIGSPAAGLGESGKVLRRRRGIDHGRECSGVWRDDDIVD